MTFRDFYKAKAESESGDSFDDDEEQIEDAPWIHKKRAGDVKKGIY